MLRWIALAFVGIPLIELFLLTWISRHVGLSATVTLVIVTGICGGALARREGLRVIRSWQSAMAELRTPDEGVIDGLLVLVGGAFLITPGILTDALGVVLLVPPTRRRVGSFVRSRVTGHFQLIQPRVRTSHAGAVGGVEGVEGVEGVVETQGQAVDDSAPGNGRSLS